jgi:hypothetical protein
VLGARDTCTYSRQGFVTSNSSPSTAAPARPPLLSYAKVSSLEVVVQSIRNYVFCSYHGQPKKFILWYEEPRAYLWTERLEIRDGMSSALSSLYAHDFVSVRESLSSVCQYGENAIKRQQFDLLPDFMATVLCTGAPPEDEAAGSIRVAWRTVINHFAEAARTFHGPHHPLSLIFGWLFDATAGEHLTSYYLRMFMVLLTGRRSMAASFDAWSSKPKLQLSYFRSDKLSIRHNSTSHLRDMLLCVASGTAHFHLHLESSPCRYSPNTEEGGADSFMASRAIAHDCSDLLEEETPEHCASWNPV